MAIDYRVFGVSTFVHSRCAYTARRDSKIGHKTKLATDGLLALGKGAGTTFPAQLATRGTIHGDVVGMCMTAVHQVKANGAGYVFLGSEMIPSFKPFTWAAMIPRPAKDGYENLKTMLLICVYITDCKEYQHTIGQNLLNYVAYFVAFQHIGLYDIPSS